MSTSPETLGYLIKRTQYLNHRALDEALSSIGLTLVQWNALREIQRRPASSMHHLAEATFNSDQAFGTLAARLQKSGLIVRAQGQGRVIVHQLTDKGAALLELGASLHLNAIQKSFSALSNTEKDALRDLLAKLDQREQS